MIVAGAGHRVGEDVDERGRYEELEAYARAHLGEFEISHRWSTQDAYSADQVPLVGRVGGLTSRVHVATGFSGWGLSNGTLAAMLVADAILGRPNRFASLFRARRIEPLRAVPRLVRENAVVARQLVGGRIARRRGSLETIARGRGRVLDLCGEKVAAYRDEAGMVHAVSAVCTHMRCIVSWNEAERTWDCPCHGSRFGFDGEVLEGPATRRLEPVAASEPPARSTFPVV